VHLPALLASILLLASVLLPSVCVRFGFGCLDGAHTKNQHCIQPPPLSIKFYAFLPLTPMSAPACCLRPFAFVCVHFAACVRFACCFAFWCLGGAHSKNQRCNQPPPLSVRFAGFLPLTPMRCVPSSLSAPACVRLRLFALRPFCCLRPFASTMSCVPSSQNNKENGRKH
jgi:hypothetical protein